MSFLPAVFLSEFFVLPGDSNEHLFVEKILTIHCIKMKHTIDLPNSMVWVLLESIHLPDILLSREIYDYYRKSKIILLPVKVH